MQTLTIDNGNSGARVGVFQGGILEGVWNLRSWIKRHQLLEYPAALSSVAPETFLPEPHPRLFRVGDFHEDGRFLDMPVHYAPGLGEDRLVCARLLHSQKRPPTVLMDAGTFITADLIDSDGLRGGPILPGPSTFLNSYGRGARLQIPALSELSKAAEGSFPADTREAISAGVKHYLGGACASLLRDFPPGAPIVLTGGAAESLAPFLPAPRVERRPELIHEALEAFYRAVCGRTTGSPSSRSLDSPGVMC